MKIISGKFRGRGLKQSLPNGIRPTTGRMKESLFSTLDSLIDIEEAFIMDLFSGSGMLWAECLSRGASEVISVDKSNQSIRYQTALIRELKCDEQVTLTKQDVIAFTKSYVGDVPDIIFCDPPYDKGFVNKALENISHNSFLSKALIIVEHSPTEFLQKFGDSVIKQKNYGDSLISILRIR